MKWIARSADGPLTITIWWGGNGVGKSVLTKKVSGQYVKIAANPSWGKDLVCIYPDPEDGDPNVVNFRVASVAGGPTSEGRTLWLEVEQKGQILPIENGPNPPKGVKLGAPFTYNVPDRRDFDVEFV